MKVGLYFGSFNPIHNGHLMLANYIVEFADIDALWFVISPQNPFKPKAGLLADYHRFELVNRAIEGFSKFRACNVEFSMPQPSYTVDTLAVLHEKYPDYQFYVIMGGDNLVNFDKWKNSQVILDNYNLLVFPRSGYDGEKYKNHPSVTILKTPLFDVSGSFIRDSISQGKDVRFFMPEKAFTYLDEMNFYKKKN